MFHCVVWGLVCNQSLFATVSGKHDSHRCGNPWQGCARRAAKRRVYCSWLLAAWGEPSFCYFAGTGRLMLCALIRFSSGFQTQFYEGSHPNSGWLKVFANRVSRHLEHYLLRPQSLVSEASLPPSLPVFSRVIMSLDKGRWWPLRLSMLWTVNKANSYVLAVADLETLITASHYLCGPLQSACWQLALQQTEHPAD